MLPREAETSRFRLWRIYFGVCLDTDIEGSGTIANGEILRNCLESDGSEFTSAILGDDRTGCILCAGRHTTINRDVIQFARSFENTFGRCRIDGERVGVRARHVLDAAVTLLLTDARTVVLARQVRRVSGDKVEGGQSTGETGEPLKAAFGIPP